MSTLATWNPVPRRRRHPARLVPDAKEKPHAALQLQVAAPRRGNVCAHDAAPAAAAFAPSRAQIFHLLQRAAQTEADKARLAAALAAAVEERDAAAARHVERVSAAEEEAGLETAAEESSGGSTLVNRLLVESQLHSLFENDDAPPASASKNHRTVSESGNSSFSSSRSEASSAASSKRSRKSRDSPIMSNDVDLWMHRRRDILPTIGTNLNGSIPEARLETSSDIMQKAVTPIPAESPPTRTKLTFDANIQTDDILAPLSATPVQDKPTILGSKPSKPSTELGENESNSLHNIRKTGTKIEKQGRREAPVDSRPKNDRKSLRPQQSPPQPADFIPKDMLSGLHIQYQLENERRKEVKEGEAVMRDTLQQHRLAKQELESKQQSVANHSTQHHSYIPPASFNSQIYQHQLYAESLGSPFNYSIIEKLLPSDSSYLFSNDTSMIKPLHQVVREVDELSAMNLLDEGWRTVERDVLEERRKMENEKTRQQKNGEGRNVYLAELELGSPFNDNGTGGGLKSALKTKSKYVSGDVEDVIMRINGL
ncbi:hypothetical protein BDR26DRAFT_240234 [Obelidium mucronatum]|nr:hypothetical protein BDR26DRAFT_240234 [Obelidium mucronatum]